MSTQKIDPEVQTFVTRAWTVSGEHIKAFDVRHSRFPGAAPTPVLLLEQLEQFKDDPTSRRLAQTIDDAMVEYARDFSGKVTFEVCALGDRNGILHTKRIHKKGEARDDQGGSPGEFSTNEKEIIAKLLEENRFLTRMVVEKDQYNRASDFRERERLFELSTSALEAQVAFGAGLQNLLNQDQERKLALRKAMRIDAAQEKAMQAGARFIPAILERFTRGTFLEGAGKDIGAAPILMRVFKSLEQDPDRAMQLFAVLKEDERRALLEALEMLGEDEKSETEKKDNEESEIKVKEKKPDTAPAAPTNGGAAG